MAVDTHQHIRVRRGLAVPTDPIWRLSIDQYHQMIRAGILTDDDAVELLEGWLIPKMPKNPPHRLSTQLTREALAARLPAGCYVEDQEPITTEDSEPEPDVAIIRGERRQYLDSHPTPQEVALVVEVSDTTPLQRDRTSKLRLYARAGIPVYWIINLPEHQIEVYTEPTGAVEAPGYQQRQDFHAAETVPLFIDGREVGQVSVRDLLP
jgi:Uma2 family endonuclease